MYKATIHNGALCKKAPYIYCILSKQFKCIYIGQTYSTYGALGRLAQHLSETESNTFKKRICSVYQYEEIELMGVEFFAYKLPDKKHFYTYARDHRESVEYLTNYSMISEMEKNSIKLSVISNTQSNPYTKMKSIQKTSDSIVSEFISAIKSSINHIEKN